jgi:hypothetical protein
MSQPRKHHQSLVTRVEFRYNYCDSSFGETVETNKHTKDLSVPLHACASMTPGHPQTPINMLSSSSSGNPLSHDDRHTAGTTHSPNDEGSMLLELIERKEFDKVVARVKSRPGEAMMTLSSLSGAHNSVMNQGNLALHEACKNQPTVEVIDTLLEANEQGIRTKGQWGYLPLHFACASRASPEVVARLIIVFPSATRTKDDHEGTLPLHLAAKWGAADEVIMALLTIHPRASGVRDSSGKTPIDHARNLSSPHVRESVIAALQRAPILCAVSKAAMNKLAYESDAKLREVVEIYQERMSQVKDRYEQDKSNSLALEVQLRKELWEVKQRSAILEERMEQLSQMLQEREMELDAQDRVLRQIQGLVMTTQQHHPSGQEQQESMDYRTSRDQRFSKPQRDPRGQYDNRNGRLSPQEQQEKEMAKSAVREWFSAETSQNRNDQPYENKRDLVQQDNSTPVTGGSSPRAAVVATVKEWFSSETRRLSDESEDDSHGVDNPARDKAESYRQSQLQQPHRPTTSRSNNDHAPLREQNTIAQQRSRDKKKNTPRDHSLLNRSRSVPRQSAVLERKESKRQSPTQHVATSSRQPSPASGIRNEGPERGENSPREPPSPTPSQSEVNRAQSRSYSSSSSRRTPNQANTGWRKNQSHGPSRQSPTRPRETYSTSKASTPTFPNRVFDDSDSLTMDSQMVEWE